MTDAAQPAKKLTKKTLFFFGISDMPIQIAFAPVIALIPNYYASDIGISLTTIATILLITRLFDGVSDPLIGYLSDRTRTRWGRRRVWMVAAVPVMMLAVYKLFMPQPTVGPSYLFWWMSALWLGWTMLLIPYYAWSAELSPDYNERSVISGWRTWLGITANVLSKLVPVIALVYFAYGGPREVLLMIGTIVLILLPLTVGLTVWQVPERPIITQPKIPFLIGLKMMWNNGPFKRLMFAFFVSSLGGASVSAISMFYIRGVLGEEDLGIAFLLVYYIAMLVGIPFWVWLSNKIGKHRTWICGLLVYAAFSPLYLLLDYGNFYWMLPIGAATGFGGGASYVMPNSMKADVIDLDTVRSGENRAAFFFSAWSLITKVSVSIGPWIALTILSFMDFDPIAGASNTASQLWGVKILWALCPPTFYVLAAIIAFKYPITEQRHKRIRAALERKNARRAVMDASV